MIFTQQLRIRFILAAQWPAKVRGMHTFISFERLACAYLLAVSCATATFVSGNQVWALLADGDATFRFPVATFLLAWIMAFTGAFMPFAAAAIVALRRRIRSPYFFIGGAVLTALAFLPLLACAYSPRHLVRLAPMLALAGLAAGTACWLVLKSSHDEDTVPAV
jgi:hypothetical protein